MDIKVKLDDIEPVIIHLKDATRIDKPIKIFANTQLAHYCEKYVPASPAKVLAGSAIVSDDCVRYPGPYAHYQYEGVVYGPNIPITEDGVVVGFFSKPDTPKIKTDRKLNYSHDIHPLAQSHWDKAAMVKHKGDLTEDIQNYIIRRYGGQNSGE